MKSEKLKVINWGSGTPEYMASQIWGLGTPKQLASLMGSAPPNSGSVCLGAWGTPHIHLGAWAFSQKHAIGDMGLGDSQTACVFLIGVRAFSRIAVASRGSVPHFATEPIRGYGALPIYTPSEIYPASQINIPSEICPGQVYLLFLRSSSYSFACALSSVRALQVSN